MDTTAAGTPTGLLIAGEWRDATSDAVVVDNPADTSTVAEVAAASPADVDAAVAAARDAGPAMAKLTEFERAELLHAVADLLDERAEALAVQMTAESGKPLVAETRDELVESAEIFRLAAEETKRLETHVMPSIERTKRVFTHRKPVGAYTLLTPFNFPMNIPAELLAAALGGGNTVVMKPSESTPLSGAALAQAVVEAGFPAGAVNVVHGRGDVGAHLVTHPGVDGIGFVGSADTAESIVRAAGLKRTLIEASGNGPQIVCDDAGLARAAEAAVFGATFVAGQCCVATERLFVQQSVHDEFLEHLVAAAAEPRLGDPMADDTSYGPVNNETVAARMDAHVADDLRVGTVLVNESTNFWEQHPPFGGAGGTRTGWGRIGGKNTLQDMTDLRTAVIDVR